MSNDGQVLFHHFDQLITLHREEREALASIIRYRKYEKGESIQAIGARCQTIYFIESGLARIYYQKDAVDITESFAFERQMVVRVESLFTGAPSKKGIQALETSDVCCIPAAPLFLLYDRFPKIERLFRLLFEHQHVQSVQRLESIQFQTAQERYQSLIEQSPLILLRAPLKHVASYLGITQVSLSRIRQQYKG
jgi:CRP-like cAMP-binding protein